MGETAKYFLKSLYSKCEKDTNFDQENGYSMGTVLQFVGGIIISPTVPYVGIPFVMNGMSNAITGQSLVSLITKGVKGTVRGLQRIL